MAAGTLTIDVTGESPEEVLGLLRHESRLYERLEGYAQQQRSLVSDEDATSLLSLLELRQRLAVELSELGRRLSPVRRGWRSFRECMSAPQRAEAERLIDDVADRLQRVIAGDERDARLLGARKTMMGREMRAAHAAGSAIAAYRQPAPRKGRLTRLDEAS